MSLDYQSHPSELTTAGVSCRSGGNEWTRLTRQKLGPNVGIKELKAAIPPHCFQPSYIRSLSYLARDCLLAAAGIVFAHRYIPLIEEPLLRYTAWAIWGYLEGLVFVGLWILGHESGHGAFSKSEELNTVVGFATHSLLLTPYFSWRSTHRRHHIYANNLAKDHNYVPPQRDDYASSLLLNTTGLDAAQLEELSEDMPLVTFLRIVLQQVIGWPWYLLTNITAADTSLAKKKSKFMFGNSHFAPAGPLFRKEEFWQIFASDVGVGAMAFLLWKLSESWSFETVALLYFQPWMWVNHWIVAITYLHHTHPNLPKFEDEAWTFLKGATATVDRELTWVGKHLFHSIIEFHVIHHLFPRIPFYHAEEATNAVLPLLGDSYHSDKQRSFLPSLWESFTKCQWVEPDNPNASPADRAMWYKGGPSTPPETSMGNKGFQVARPGRSL